MLRAVYVAAASEQGPRPYNEDRCTLVPDFNIQASGVADAIQRTYVAVFDGHSGKRAATTAATRLHAYLASNRKLIDKAGTPAESSQHQTQEEEKDVADALRAAFERTDQDIIQTTDSGCTAVVVLRIGQVLYIAHTGDSRAVICSSGKAEQLTEDHKPLLPRERQRIEARGGKIDYDDNRVVSSRSRLAMSRALGDPSHKLETKEPVVEAKPDVGVLELQPNDEFVVLASDGLWDYVSNQEAVEVVRAAVAAHGAGASARALPAATAPGEGPTPADLAREGAAQAAAKALVGAAMARKTHDNVTAAVMLFEWG